MQFIVRILRGVPVLANWLKGEWTDWRQFRRDEHMSPEQEEQRVAQIQDWKKKDDIHDLLVYPAAHLTFTEWFLGFEAQLEKKYSLRQLALEAAA